MTYTLCCGSVRIFSYAGHSHTPAWHSRPPHRYTDLARRHAGAKFPLQCVPALRLRTRPPAPDAGSFAPNHGLWNVYEGGLEPTEFPYGLPTVSGRTSVQSAPTSLEHVQHEASALLHSGKVDDADGLTSDGHFPRAGAFAPTLAFGRPIDTLPPAEITPVTSAAQGCFALLCLGRGGRSTCVPDATRSECRSVSSRGCSGLRARSLASRVPPLLGGGCCERAPLEDRPRLGGEMCTRLFICSAGRQLS